MCEKSLAVPVGSTAIGRSIPSRFIDHIIDCSVAAGDQDVEIGLVDSSQHLLLLVVAEVEAIGFNQTSVCLINLDDLVEPLGDDGLSRLWIIDKTDSLHVFSC